LGLLWEARLAAIVLAIVFKIP